MLFETKLPPASPCLRSCSPGSHCAVSLHLLARVHGRQRRRNPARFAACSVAYAREPTCFRPNSLPASTIAARISSPLLVRSPDFKTRSAGHAVPQRAHLASRDLDLAHVEELDFREWSAVQLLDDLLGVRSLNLVAVARANHRPCRPGFEGDRSSLRDRHVVIRRSRHGTRSSWPLARVPRNTSLFCSR